MKVWVAACCVALAAALPAAVDAQQKKGGPAKAAKKKAARVKYEKLACRLGTEDEHARIAVLLANGKVDSFAYYSKWKPRTCSMDVQRGDAYSRWEDTGNTTVVTLTEDKGAFLIDHSPGRYHFIFRDIDRMRYCGMDGKVNGTLTIFKGRAQCQVAGVMDRDDPELQKPEIARAGVAGPLQQPAAGQPGAGGGLAAEPIGANAPQPAAVTPPAAPEPAASDQGPAAAGSSEPASSN